MKTQQIIPLTLLVIITANITFLGQSSIDEVLPKRPIANKSENLKTAAPTFRLGF